MNKFAYIYTFNQLIIITSFVFFPFLAIAEDDPCKGSENKEEKVNKGIVASVGVYSGATAVQGDTGGDAPGEEPSMITGSIKKINDKKCSAVIVNNSQCKTYSVSFAIKGIKHGTTQERTITTSSARLAPKASKEVSFACDSTQNNYAVDVISAR